MFFYPTILSNYTKLEKCFILVFIIHSIALLSFLLKSTQYAAEITSKLAYSFLFVYIYILTSFIITILIKTLLHGFVFCFFNFGLIIAYAVMVNKSCGDTECFNVKKYVEVYHTNTYTLIVQVFFEFIYIVLVILLWYNRQWKFIEDIGNTKKTNINKMYKRYQYQAGLVHANFISIASWAYYLAYVILGSKVENLEHHDIKSFIMNITMPDQIIYLIVLLFILKVIRDESKKTIYFVHLLNLLECFLIIYRTVAFCPIDYVEEPGCNLLYKFRNFPELKLILIIGILTLFITLLQSINLILCHKNFGNNLGFYMKYEEIPSEFEYNDDIPTKRNQENYIE